MQVVQIDGKDTNGKPVHIAVNDDGELKIAEITANIDPTGLSTATKQDSAKGVLDDIKGEVSLRDIGSPVRVTNDTTSQSVAVPASAKAFWVQAEGDEVRLEIDGAATATSTIRVPEDTIIVYPITGGSQTLYSYGSGSSYSNVRFLG